MLVLGTNYVAPHCMRNTHTAPRKKYRATLFLILTTFGMGLNFQLTSHQETEAVARPLTWHHGHFYSRTSDLNKHYFIYF